MLRLLLEIVLQNSRTRVCPGASWTSCCLYNIYSTMLYIDGYLDLDTVQLLDGDFQLISRIRKLSDTTKDKLVFTVRM